MPWVAECSEGEARWAGYLRSPWEVGQPVAPLSALPTEMQARINALANAPTPPPYWLDLGLARIPSRAAWEWYMRRGRNPQQPREPISRETRDAVIERDRGICQLCLRPITRTDAIHIDHIVPVSLGGDSLAVNLQLTHDTCNMRKGNRV